MSEPSAENRSSEGRIAAGGGVTIPGYQPVELLGSSPSFGAWVRAVQVRMDRHVLLKVLKPDKATQEYFAREIATVVQFDGDGVLRAIDEGTVEGFRYLVVDEAEGIPLTSAVIGGESGWCELAKTALDVLRRTLDRGFLLLPSPPAAWRRLPAGDFSLADMGWLIPIGDKIPKLSVLPEELRGRVATPSDVVRSFEITGKKLAAEFGVPLPLAWKNATVTLSALDQESTVDEVISSLESARNAVDPGTESRTTSFLLFGLLLVAAVVAGTITVLGPDQEPGEDPEVEIQSEPGLAEGGTEPPEQGSSAETEEALMRKLAEEAGWTAYDFAFPGRSNEESSGPVPLPLTEIQRQALTKVAEEHPTTRAAALALHDLDCDRLVRLLQLEEEWMNSEKTVQQKFEQDRLADAEATLERFRSDYERRGADLIPAIESAMARLRRSLVERGAVKRQELRQMIDEKNARREYRKAASEVGRVITELLLDDQPWAEEERQRLLATADRYEAVEKAVDDAIVTAHREALAADFEGANDSLQEVSGEEEFEEIAQLRLSWLQNFQRAAEVWRAIHRELSSDQRSRKAHPYALQVGEDLRGRVLSVEPTRFEIKISGRREQRVIEWLELTPDQWRELGGELVNEETNLLLRIFLGESEAIEAAARLDPVPIWYEAFLERSQREANEALLRLLSLGENALAEGNVVGARQAAREIVLTIDSSLWESRRALLESWCRTYWLVTGPLSAFPGASGKWDKDRNITLRFDFSQPETESSWISSSAGRGRRVRAGEAMRVRGSIWLAPGGRTDLFEEDLRASVTMVASNAKSPNLNLVLFARRERNQHRGDLYGLGYRPLPPVPTKIERNGLSVFLPANICGPLAAAEAAAGERLAFLQVRPQVSSGEGVELVVRSTPSKWSFHWNEKALTEEFSRPKRVGQRGTVEFRTYGSEGFVGAITIDGQMTQTWWDRFSATQIAEDLGL